LGYIYIKHITNTLYTKKINPRLKNCNRRKKYKYYIIAEIFLISPMGMDKRRQISITGRLEHVEL
jgi:hypothetical protein